jgi:quercetin dioxygenase-like cupin family protein
MFCKNNSAVTRELLPGVSLETLVHGEKTLMGRFSLAKDAAIPAHAHPHEQTGVLISGKLLFTSGGREFTVETGDSWCIPGNEEHSVKVLEDAVAIEVFSPVVREDYLT